MLWGLGKFELKGQEAEAQRGHLLSRAQDHCVLPSHCLWGRRDQSSEQRKPRL